MKWVKKSSRIEKLGKPAVTPEISKRTFEIDLTSRFRDCVRGFPKEVRAEVGRRIDELRGTLGQPHRHSGLGLRKLHANLFECRAGLEIRLLFQVEHGLITFVFAGDHDAVRRYAREKI